MRKTVIAAALAALLLPAGPAAADEAIYAPYKACMANCQAEEGSCIDHIAPGSADAAAVQAECVNTKAACVAECQFLPMPGSQPAEGAQQGEGGEGQGSAAQKEEPVQHQEAPAQDPVPQDEPAPPQDAGQVEQPVHGDGAPQGGAPQEGGAPGQPEPETLNGIKIYKFE